MLNSLIEDQENLPVGVAALVTPSRQPLKSVLDSRVNNGTQKKCRRSDLSTRTLFNRKQRSKRLSAPLYNLHHVMPSLIKSLQPSSSIHNEIQKKDDLPPDEHKGEASVEDFVEEVVGKILKGVEKNKSNEPEPSQRKMEEYESIILQMNKERLRLERQLSQLMKEQARNKKPQYASATAILEKELATKQKELNELREQCHELQELSLELPGVKKDLQKSRQETKAVSELLFQSRKNSAELKDQLFKLNTQVKDFGVLAEQYRELQERIETVTKERDDNMSEVHRLCTLVDQKEQEVQRNRTHCVTLKGLVDRLENAAFEAEKYVAWSRENETVLQYQIDELSLSLETNSQLLKDNQKHVADMEDQLNKTRVNEKEANEHCGKLIGQNEFLASELDIHKMEISRQEDLINRQQREITDLKEKLENSLEQMEYLQSQQREVNEFTEEERKTLEVTLSEMENQLKLSNRQRTELDVSLKNQSAKYEELVEQMKHSRGLLQDTQEELEATQSQAHWIVLQQEAVIAETAKELIEISALVNKWLWKFGKPCSPDEVEKEKVETEITEMDSPSTNQSVVPAKSLVQSVLDATAMRESESELRPADNLSVKLSPIFEESESEVDCPQLASDDEEKPMSLSEQALELKQALRQLMEIVSVEAPSVQAENTIQRLQKERVLLEEEHKSALTKALSELEDSRISETKLRREVAKKSSEIVSLQQDLEQSRENLQYSWKKLDSLGKQCEKNIDQQTRITELTEDVQRLSEDIKALEGEKESLSQQLQESLTKLDELSQSQPDLSKTQDVLGKVLAEKFDLEKKVQTFKEKSVAYRMEAQDYMTEYKYRTDSKIRVLEGNIEKAETEICRLDALMEKIRLVLHKYQDVISSCPDLNKLLSFLDGHDIQ